MEKKEVMEELAKIEGSALSLKLLIEKYHVNIDYSVVLPQLIYANKALMAVCEALEGWDQAVKKVLKQQDKVQ